MNYYIYILKSQRDATYYIGYTLDINKRLVSHNKGKNKYTKDHTPYIVVYSQAFEDKGKAKLMEKKIKGIGASRYLKIIGSPAL